MLQRPLPDEGGEDGGGGVISKTRSPDERSDIRDFHISFEPRISLRSCGLLATTED
jgi:hypothetical protein